MSIFISIASYKDYLLALTLTEAYKKAKNPDQLFFGLALSYDTPFDHSMIPDSQKYVVTFDPDKRPGVHRKRALLVNIAKQKQCDYFLQLDSHMRFVNNWDEKLINDLLELELVAQSDKVLFSGCEDIVFNEDIHSDTVSFYPNNVKKSMSILTFEDTGFYFLQKEDRSEAVDYLAGYQKTNIIKSGFIFAKNSFINDVEYCQLSEEMDEEQHLSWQTYIMGWDVYINSTKNFIVHNPDHKVLWGEDWLGKPRKFGSDNAVNNDQLMNIHLFHQLAWSHEIGPSMPLNPVRRSEDFFKEIEVNNFKDIVSKVYPLISLQYKRLGFIVN
jgi:hypothetical protein